MVVAAKPVAWGNEQWAVDWHIAEDEGDVKSFNGMPRVGVDAPKQSC